ncbi:hypothetical protein [Sandarakinorhabdus sp.]|uniref:hypothetical protein n=1 Tax=Sandarakinorhabdus sp. TaxID=1916663 RepID=UPI00286E076B|nr:hypothetical protein [Sandarakinorhabdus sp.]
MNRTPHPTDIARRLRQLAGPLLLAIGVIGCAVAMLLMMLIGSGWIGPEGLRW